MNFNYTDQVLAELRAQWEYSQVTNFALYERYYGGDHPWENAVNADMRNERDSDGSLTNERFWKPANMAYVVIEEAVGYWAGAEVEILVSQGGVRDTEKSKLVTAQIRSIFNQEREEIARAQALYGEGILRIRPLAGGVVKSYGVSPYQEGPWCMTFCEDPDDPYRVTTCIYQFVQGDYLWAQHITPYEIRLIKLAHIGSLGYAGARVGASNLAGVDWLSVGKEENRVENPWGIVPVYSFVNGNGASDLFPMLHAQDSLNKAIFNLESSAEFHGFPLLEVKGYAGRYDADSGVPLDIEVGAGSYILVDEKGGVKRLESGDLTQLLAAESRGYLRVAQQARSPAVLMEFKGLGDSGRVPGFLLEPLKMRLNSKLSGAKHALELLARDLPKYRMKGAIELDEFQVDVEIKMPLPSDKIGEAESRAREVDVGAMTGQQSARLRGEDPEQWKRERLEELEMAEMAKAKGQIEVEKSKPKPTPPPRAR